MKNLLTLLILFVLAGCDREATPPAVDAGAAPVADVLYRGATIWTGAAGIPDASALAVRDGKIIYVGPDDGIDVDAERTVRLDGRFLMPGFIDNHVHFFTGGAALASVDLRDAASPEEFSERIRAYAETLPAGRWVLNGNWDHQLWGGELPHRKWIDAATPERPVFVMRLDGHMGLANTAALAIAGITAATESPAGGEIVRDAAGEPTGVLKDNAMNLVLDRVPAPSDDEMLEWFTLAQTHALSAGLTQVHAVTANPKELSRLDYLRLAESRGLLKLRIHAYMPLEHWSTLSERVQKEGHGDGRLRWGGVKGFVDGSLGSGTAWFHEAYTDNPEEFGFPLTEPEQLQAQLRAADAAGRRLAIHAIGDRAIDLLVDAMRDIAGGEIAARRYRIEHFQHPTRDAIEAIADSGIIASMQPYHAIDDGRWLEAKIGSERARTTYPFRSLIDAGAILTFGSDWPVAPLAPLAGIYAAVTRRTIDGANPGGWQPQERITVEEALVAYTRNNAYAVFEEETGGTLEPGKRADFVVLSADPRTVDPESIREIEIIETVIGGDVAWAKKNNR